VVQIKDKKTRAAPTKSDAIENKNYVWKLVFAFGPLNSRESGEQFLD
jgi:hypothetical protein